MGEYCPTCGHEIRVVQGGEGTAHYEPVERARELICSVRDRLKMQDPNHAHVGFIIRDLDAYLEGK